MRRLGYIYELPDWPVFRWNREKIADALITFRHEQGRLVGRMESLGFPLRQEAVLQSLTSDVLKSSEIEGEKLDADQVRSSVARRLGMDIGGLKSIDRQVEGVVEMAVDATGHYGVPLTSKRLFHWHSLLFPDIGRLTPIRIGSWRDDAHGPMQVVSGPIGREKVHYEAPSADKVPGGMRLLLEWFNGDAAEDDWVTNAAIAHLWFVTIHPFEDGNGRIARAIADMALARSENSPQRFYSMSAQIREERNAYYDILEQTQHGTMDVTPWMDWFLGCLRRAIERAEQTVGSVLFKARFWQSLATANLNERQRAVLNRLLDNFEGKLTSSKWAKIAKTSQDTAARDIARLVEIGVLVQNPGGGRSTSYCLAMKPPSLATAKDRATD